MINKIPSSWKYNDSLEMLFLFYQCADELLSEVTPDSYALPLHNSITLLYEIKETYSMLEKYGISEKYYKEYIPPIIEEFLSQTEDDYLLKQKLDMRLSSVRTGFQIAENQPKQLSAWLEIVNQICTTRQYLSAYKDEIIRLVTSTKDKNKLLYCVSTYFITLRWIG